MPLALLQARVESVAFVAVTVSQFVVRVLLCVALIVWLHWGVAGRADGLGRHFGDLRRRPRGARAARAARRWPDRERIVGLLRFALPFLPGGLCFFILQYGDRFFLLHWRGAAEVGVYGLGYKVALAVATFSLGPLYMVWSARMYKAAEEADAPRVFGRMFTRILSAFLLVGLAACLFQDEVVAVLGGAAYAAAAPIVAPVVLAGFFQTAAALMDAGFYVRRRTEMKMCITLAATVVILILYFVLIPPLRRDGGGVGDGRRLRLPGVRHLESYSTDLSGGI